MSQERYRKQMLFSGIGAAGQQQIRQTRVLLVGCGALGSVIAESLTRAGIGGLRIVDRDFVDLSNLQRQVLFEESDVHSHAPKAVAAVEKLQRINSEVALEPMVADVNSGNLLSLLAGCDLVMDGTDNFETRFLINDACLEKQIPWVSGGVLGAAGQVFLVVPGQTACLRCLLDEEPPRTETCDTAGVLGPAVNVIASLQVMRALQWITRVDAAAEPDRRLTMVDVWAGSFQQLDLTNLWKSGGCAACGQGERLWLKNQRGSQSTVLCGRNSVQISPAEPRREDLTRRAEQWQRLGDVKQNPFLLWFRPAEQPQFQIHLFADGRAIIQGTEDLAEAKTVAARYIGS